MRISKLALMRYGYRTGETIVTVHNYLAKNQLPEKQLPHIVHTVFCICPLSSLPGKAGIFFDCQTRPEIRNTVALFHNLDFVHTVHWHRNLCRLKKLHSLPRRLSLVLCRNRHRRRAGWRTESVRRDSKRM
jgi:hypothetical protein